MAPPTSSAIISIPDPVKTSSGRMETIHTVIDVIGVVPGFGDVCDEVNALLYLWDGDYGNAGLSAIAMIPFWGNFATGAKWGNRIMHAADDGANIAGGVAKNIRNSPLVSEILKKRKGSIKDAPLPPGSPSWSEIRDMTMEEIEAKARANVTGYKTIKKLLGDGRFKK